MSYSYRRANLNDVIFLSKVIMEAEKSGSDKIGLATIFNLSEAELQNYLIQILEEEIAVSYTHLDVYKRQIYCCSHKGTPYGKSRRTVEEKRFDYLPNRSQRRLFKSE